MGDSDQYKGSQAFNNIGNQNESVNPNTGSLNFSKPLIELRGKKEEINLLIKLEYSAGTKGILGLPDGWALSISYVLPGKSVTTQGRTYVIDADWTDGSGYQSGLKYVNNHGMKFEVVEPPQELPSGEPGVFSYSLRYSDGAMDYFDGEGKLLQHRDIFDSYHYYSYVSSESGDIFSGRLGYIKDSWGQIITLEIEEDSFMRIIAPDKGATTIKYSEQGVYSVVDPMGYTTDFEYTRSKDQVNLFEIQYRNGLISRFEYTWVEYNDLDGRRGLFPAVQDHILLDGANTMQHTSYQYGVASDGQTYTGAARGYRIGGLKDGLMEGNDPEYLYDVTVNSLDAEGNLVSSVRIWYDWMHLTVKQETFKVEGGTITNGYLTNHTYDIATDPHYRSAAYNMPIEIEQFRAVGPSGAYVPLFKNSKEYNTFGNLISDVESIWEDLSAKYVTRKRSTKTYIDTKNEIQMVKEEIERDELSGQEIVVRYQLTNDQKSVKRRSTFELLADGSGWKPQKTYTYDYDGSGRMVKERVAWSQGGPAIPPGTPSASFKTKIYDYDGAGTLTEKILNTVGESTLVSYDVRQRTGPMIWKTLPGGEFQTWKYDEIGRLTQESDFLGGISSISYSVGRGDNFEKHISPVGLITIRLLDALGRQITVSDNGDPTEKVPYRTVTKLEYDTLSRIRSKTDAVGRKTTYDSYDSFNRLTQSTDYHGNITLSRFDDTELKVESLINGRLREVIYRDSIGQVIKTETYPDPDDSHINYELVTTNSYNGFGKEIRKIIAQRTKSTPFIVLKDTAYKYNAELALLSETVKGQNDWNPTKHDLVRRTYTFDLFGNRYSYTKETTYLSTTERFKHFGPVDIYDDNNRLVTHRNQLGHEENYSHDSNGRLVKITRPDRSSINYTYDSAGQVTQTKTSDEVVTYAYSSIGRLSRAQTNYDEFIDYEYNLDGTCRTILYKGGLKQQYEFDQFSRIIKETDVLGVVRNFVYDSQGLLQQRTCKSDKLSYSYGVANHKNGILLSTKLEGAENYTRTLSYDGFGRPDQVLFSTPTAQVILETKAIYSPRGQIRQLAVLSKTQNHKEVRQRREFSYDGVGHLIGDRVEYLDTNLATVTSQNFTKYSYDGNSNVASIVIDGVIKKMKYNAIDQRIGSGFIYDLVGRMIRDDAGRQYTFDSSDRLVKVTSVSHPNTSLSYRPDDSLSRIINSEADAKVYFSQKRINAMRTVEPQTGARVSQTSFLSDSGRLVAGYHDSDADPTYFFENQSSNVLAFDKKSTLVQSYKAYGAANTTTFRKFQKSFGFAQEFTDPNSGLIYLRSRYYNPEHMSFISPDAVHKENRYSYCLGDPVNFVDPTGNSRETLAQAIGTAIGLAVSIILGALSDGALAPLGVEIGASATSAISGALSGAAGGIVGGAVVASMTEQQFSVSKILVDGTTGLVGGSVSKLTSTFVRGEMTEILNKIIEKGFPAFFANKIPVAIGAAVSQPPKLGYKSLINVPINHFADKGNPKLENGTNNTLISPIKDFQRNISNNQPERVSRNGVDIQEKSGTSLVIMRGLLPDSKNWENDSAKREFAIPISSQESLDGRDVGLGFGGALKWYGGMRV